MPLAEVIKAGCTTDNPMPHLIKAAEGFDAAEMALHSAAVRYRLADFTNREDALTLRKQSERWFGAQEVLSPARLTRMLIVV